MIIPFMNFHGQCEEAVLYYQNIFKFKDPFFLKFAMAPSVPFTIPADYEDKIMFTEFTDRKSVVEGNIVDVGGGRII